MPLDINTLTIKTHLLTGHGSGGSALSEEELEQAIALALVRERAEMMRELLPIVRDHMTDRLNR